MQSDAEKHEEQTTNDDSANDNGDDALARKTERIRRLNDRLRRTGQGGAITVTSGIAALDERLLSRIMLAVATFEAFSPDNDPYGEHDCAGLVVEGHRILWKIDYYDPTLTWLSEDPADPAKTRRVSAAVRSTSVFGWKGDPQICAILLGNRRPEIGGDDSGYSRFSPETDVHQVTASAQLPSETRRSVDQLLLAERQCSFFARRAFSTTFSAAPLRAPDFWLICTPWRLR